MMFHIAALIHSANMQRVTPILADYFASFVCLFIELLFLYFFLSVFRRLDLLAYFLFRWFEFN